MLSSCSARHLQNTPNHCVPHFLVADILFNQVPFTLLRYKHPHVQNTAQCHVIVLVHAFTPETTVMFLRKRVCKFYGFNSDSPVWFLKEKISFLFRSLNQCFSCHWLAITPSKYPLSPHKLEVCSLLRKKEVIIQLRTTGQGVVGTIGAPLLLLKSTCACCKVLFKWEQHLLWRSFGTIASSYDTQESRWGSTGEKYKLYCGLPNNI